MTKNQVDWINAQENIRSNKAKELETNRSNLANEKETNRANLAREKETNRSNLVHESIDLSALNETKRSNLAREAETNRSNLAKEYETNRSNLAKEKETSQHNRTMESIDLGKLNETIRSNKANEYYNLANLQERQRNNLQTEAIQNRQADAAMKAAEAREMANTVNNLKTMLNYEIDNRKLSQSQKQFAEQLQEQISEFNQKQSVSEFDSIIKGIKVFFDAINTTVDTLNGID